MSRPSIKTKHSKVDLAKLSELMDLGWGTKRIAIHFDVSEARISQKKKEIPAYRAKLALKSNTVKPPSTNESIDVIKQIYGLNSNLLAINEKLFAHIAEKDFDITDRDNLRFIEIINRTSREVRAQLEFYSSMVSQLEDMYAKDVILDRFVTVLGEVCNEYPDTQQFIKGKLEDGIIDAEFSVQDRVEIE